MPGLVHIEAALARVRLAIPGGLAVVEPEAALPPATRSLALIGPGTGFWPYFREAPEYSDGQPDPLDRWSKRHLSDIAKRFDGTALFPSDGPPFPPFVDWALRSGAFHTSPIGLLVHPSDGLMTSLRGALALPYQVVFPASQPAPCEQCEVQPCRTACPVGAFEHSGYVVTKCHNQLDTSAGSVCMEQGCAARRACPASQGTGRPPEQLAFHMRAFHGNR